MSAQYFDQHYAICLLIATAWTTLFSMTIRQPLRGCGNLGILACYVLFMVMLFRLRFLTALATWCVFGLAGGLLYLCYELVMRWQIKDPVEKPAVSLAPLFHGPLAWPIMIPEVIEYTLAELGLLAPKTLDVAPFPSLHWDGFGWSGEAIVGRLPVSSGILLVRQFRFPIRRRGCIDGHARGRPGGASLAHAGQCIPIPAR